MFTFGLRTYSGAAKQADFLAKMIASKKVVIFDKSPGSRFFFPDIEHRTDQYTVVFLPRFPPARWVIVAIMSRGVKIFHFHGFVKEMLCLAVALRKKILLKTTILGGDDFEAQATYALPRIRRFLISKTDFNIVQTVAAKNINSRYLDPQKIVVVPNLINAKTEPVFDKRDNFLFVGVVCERKKAHLAIRLFVQNFAENPNAVLYVIGPLPTDQLTAESDRDYLKKCLAEVPQALAPRVQFTGNLERSELDAYYRQAKSLILLSDAEGLPNVVLEAMSWNCVPILSPMGGVAVEILGSDPAGFIIDDISKKAISTSAIDKLIENATPWRRIRDNFDANSRARQIEDIYDKLTKVQR